MKMTARKAKVPFGTAKFSKVKNVRYLSWEDAFDIEFEDGLCILEPHATIRKANKIEPKARFDHLEIEDSCHAGFCALQQWPNCRDFMVLHPRTAAKKVSSARACSK